MFSEIITKLAKVINFNKKLFQALICKEKNATEIRDNFSIKCDLCSCKSASLQTNNCLVIHFGNWSIWIFKWRKDGLLLCGKMTFKESNFHCHCCHLSFFHGSINLTVDYSPFSTCFPPSFFAWLTSQKCKNPMASGIAQTSELIYARLSAFVTSVRSVKRHFSSSVSASNSINQKISLLLFGKLSRFLLYGVTQEQMEWQRHWG